MTDNLWMIRNNEWFEIEVPKWDEKIDLEGYLRDKLGVEPVDQIGSDPRLFCVTLYRRKHGSDFPAEYIISIERVSTWDLFCAHDFPSMWGVWRDACSMQMSSDLAFFAEP